MSKATSSNPVERAEAELESLLAEFNKDVAADQGNDPEPGDNKTDDEPKPDPKPDPPPNDDDESYKQKWQSLQGIVRSKDTQITTLSQQINDLMSQNQEIMQRLQAQSAAPQQASSDEGDFATLVDSIKAQFGDAFGAAFEKLAEKYNQSDAKINTINEELKKVKVKTAKEKAEAMLTELCPIWRKVDKDPEFLTWLDQPAPYSNKKLIEVLNDTYASGDVQTTASIFNEFIAFKTKNSQPAPDQRAGMVTPNSRSTSSNVQAQGEPKIWSEAEAKKFYRDVQTGVWRGREADVSRIDAEITQAYYEGRVR